MRAGLRPERLFLAAAAGMILGGGSSSNAWTLGAPAGVNVTVSDAGGLQICDATVVVQDGTYTETLRSQACGYFGAFERTGNYTLTISAPGHATKTVTGVVVTDGECHVHAQSVNVVLN